jgi:DNA-binding MarR family transcriptional regulator
MVDLAVGCASCRKSDKFNFTVFYVLHGLHEGTDRRSARRTRHRVGARAPRAVRQAETPSPRAGVCWRPHITPSQTSVLLRLEKDGPATASSLARAEGMRAQSMGPLVAALEAAGLVSGTPDPADGRQTILSPTDACRKWIQEGRAARQDWLTRTIQARLSPREQEDLAASVELLKRLADD